MVWVQAPATGSGPSAAKRPQTLRLSALLALVALIGLGLGITELRRRARLFHELSARYAYLEHTHAASATSYGLVSRGNSSDFLGTSFQFMTFTYNDGRIVKPDSFDSVSERGRSLLRKLAAWEHAMADHCHRLRQKYARAAERPWINPPPDAPAPAEPSYD